MRSIHLLLLLAGCGGGEETRLCHSPEYGRVQYRSLEEHDAEAQRLPEPCELILIDNTLE